MKTTPLTQQWLFKRRMLHFTKMGRRQLRIRRRSYQQNKTGLIKLIVFAFMVVVAGCKDKVNYKPPSNNVAKYWHIINIDGCEYIESSRWNDIPLIHKANCKNPIHIK